LRWFKLFAGSNLQFESQYLAIAVSVKFKQLEQSVKY